MNKYPHGAETRQELLRHVLTVKFQPLRRTPACEGGLGGYPVVEPIVEFTRKRTGCADRVLRLGVILWPLFTSAACSSNPSPSVTMKEGGADGSGPEVVIPGKTHETQCGSQSDASSEAALDADGPGCIPSRMVSFRSHVRPLLACSGELCHTTFDRPSGLVHTPSAQCCGTQELVVPFHPEESYILRKLTGSRMCAGSRMPASGSLLDAEEIQTIADWICLGAKDD